LEDSVAQPDECESLAAQPLVERRQQLLALVELDERSSSSTATTRSSTSGRSLQRRRPGALAVDLQVDASLSERVERVEPSERHGLKARQPASLDARACTRVGNRLEGHSAPS
jgi:hypothetical protein